MTTHELFHAETSCCSYNKENILCSLCTLLHNMGVIFHVVALTILLASQFVKVSQSAILIGFCCTSLYSRVHVCHLDLGNIFHHASFTSSFLFTWNSHDCCQSMFSQKIPFCTLHMQRVANPI